MKILVTPTSFCGDRSFSALLRLRAFCPELVFNPTGKPLPAEGLIPLLQGCDGYLAGLDFVTDEVLSAAPSLRAISRYGVGVDRVALGAAHRLNILVSNTPGVNAEAVAELAFAHILSLARKIPMLDRSTRNGGWVRSTGIELEGRTIGVLGLGAIGKRVAAIAQGFSMRVIAYDPYIDTAYAAAHGIECAGLDAVLRKADVVSLHLPLADGTRHLFNRRTLASMKDGAFLVNTSRGGIIDESAALEALAAGKLGGLGLDAFEEEPPNTPERLARDNVIMTPHTGAHTEESITRMADMAVDNLIAMLTGGACSHLV